MGREERACKALLILTAIAMLGVGMVVVYFINPKPEEPSQERLEVRIEVKDNAESGNLLPPPPEPEEEKPSDEDVAQKVIEDHIRGYLLKGYTFNGMPREDYIKAIAEACVVNADSIEKALWIASMIQKESSYRICAKPGKATNSSARGFIQVIWRYHGAMLQKHGISKADLDSDISKSIQAGILVFDYYLRLEHGDFRKALRRYRGLSVTEKEQNYYYNYISSVYNKLQKDLKEVKAS